MINPKLPLPMQLVKAELSFGPKLILKKIPEARCKLLYQSYLIKLTRLGC